MTSEAPRLCDAQRWVLGAHALLLRRNKMSLDVLGGMERPGYSFVSARMMARDWGIFTAEEARARIDWLMQTGHRSELGSAWEQDEFAAYDWVRAAGVAAWSWHAYLLDLDEAWACMLAAAERLQATYRSWAEVGASYARGYERMSGDDDELELLRDGIIPDLVKAADSPWLLAFDTALAPAAQPPRIERNERVVDASDPDAFATIREALDAASPGDLVRIRPGTYHERIDIVTPVEIEGDGDVFVEHDAGCCVFVKASSAVITNLHFRSGTNQSGEAMHAVIVHGHFLRLVDCEVRSARSGVYLTNDKAYAALQRTRIYGTASVGVLAEGGLLAMDRCVVAASGVGNVQIGGETEAHFVDTTFEQAAQTGLTLLNGAVAEASRCTSRANLAGVDVVGGASLELTDGQVVDNAGGGVRVFGVASSLRAIGVRIADNGEVNVGANEATRISLFDCEIIGGKLAVWADHGAHIALEACRVGRGADGLSRKMDGGEITLERCAADEQPEA